MLYEDIFEAYIEAYSLQCKNYLPLNSIQLTKNVCIAERITRNGWGVEISRYCDEWEKRGTGIYISPAMNQAKSKLLLRRTQSPLENVLKAFSGRGIWENAINLENAAIKIKSDMRQLVKANGCDSQSLKRFEDNLLRFIEGNKPLKLTY
jgi:hypothetical protein